MRPRLRILIVFLLVGVIGLASWIYRSRARIARQWACYRVGASASLDEARDAMAWFERGADRDAKLQQLVGKWGTGNERFDLYLAQYVAESNSSGALRKAFSLEFAWREELLSRWAHFWSWRAPLEPDRQVASILDYLDILISAEPTRPISWREVLDLQAVFQLTGQPKLAKRLTPENWHRRYRRWLQLRPDRLDHIPRPAMPFPETENPVSRGG